jgi:CxxC motif-containing protein (DUF1111 family)
MESCVTGAPVRANRLEEIGRPAVVKQEDPLTAGCYLCHTPTLRSGDAAVAALANRDVNLYSDLLLHGMGPELADDIYQAEAGPDEFRTAPLWGLARDASQTSTITRISQPPAVAATVTW